jgi:Bacterial regulatory proteins, gntR family
MPPGPAWLTRADVEGGPVIGVCWQPGQPAPAPIFGHGSPVGEGRFAVRVRYGDSVLGRSPTHYEWHTLGMRPGEAVVEVSRTNRLREVFHSRRVGITPDGSTMQGTGLDGTAVVHGEDAFCVVDATVDTPDQHTPRWRRIIEDIHTDVAAGRHRPGDELPTTAQLSAMYGCSASTVRRALRHLTTEGLIAGRPGWGRFITAAGRRGE